MSSIYEINFTNLSGKDDKYYKFTILSLGEVSIIGKKRTSANITGLSKNKKYYVRIRTYKKGLQTKYVSKWSPVKSAKVK